MSPSTGTVDARAPGKYGLTGKGRVDLCREPVGMPLPPGSCAGRSRVSGVVMLYEYGEYDKRKTGRGRMRIL